MEDYDNVSHDSDSVNTKSQAERAVTFGGVVTGPRVTRAPQRLFTESRRIVAAHQQDDRPLRVDPGEIRFEAIEPGVLYVMSFSVRNATKAAQRIRIRAPKSGFFALNYIPTGAVAPGIDVRAEIECQLPAIGTDLLFLDSIVVTMGQHSLEIPLSASKPSAIVTFPNLCNLGYVAEGQSVSAVVPFENAGQVATVITFKPPNDTRVKLSPSKFELQPGGGKANVTVSFEGRELGPWREFIQVNGTSMIDPGVLDLTVQVVDQKLNLLAANNGGILDNVDFGALFYGQYKIVDALLVNTGPQQLSFAVLYEDEMGILPQTEDGSASMVPPIEKMMTISPAQGIIKPFSQVPVKIKFNPVLPTPVKGFASNFLLEAKELKFATRRALIDCSEMGQRLTLNMTGSASSPSVAVTPTMLRFGACAVNDRRDILVTLNNKSASKTAFEFSHLAHFKISTDKGELQPYQSISVIVSFTPTQLGAFKNVIKLSLGGGLSVVDLRVLADADQVGKKEIIGGPDKLPEDFEKSLKFVDPEEIKAMRQAKKEGEKMLSGTSAAPFHPLQDDKTFFSNSSSKLRDEIYGFDGSNEHLLESSSAIPWKTRQEHNRTYNQYLQKAHEGRLEAKRNVAAKRIVARGGADRNDPFGVDMGIERGLEEPELKVPQAGEPLWLKNRMDGTGGGSRSRVPLDENRLIQKKWPSTPATQAEMRDCAAEITLEELALVQASHKTIDFGKVCVGSSSVKSFSVTNDLSRSVLVQVRDFEPESRMSKPDAQIVPAGAVAGFDISFTSKVLGKYKKSFSYEINGNYSYKVTIVAEIVPIELEMNKTELIMDFPDDSLEPSLSQDLFLKNPGNAVADFLWGSSGAFVCKPDKGSINPGQTAIISIVWTPAVDKRNKEELALNVTGGVDKTLSVTGIIKEVKATFDEKKLSLGTVAVGVETKLKATIRNTGQNSAVYFVDPFDDKLGVRVVNDKGIIPPGETIKLEVLLTPKVAMTYNQSQLSVSIRGGKPLTVKFSGESVIPALEMKEKNFIMGSVAIGSEIRAPLTLVNKATIPASLTLDLTNFPDFKPSISGPKAYAEIAHEQFDSSNNSIILVKPVGDDGSLSPNTAKKLNLWRIRIEPGSTLRGSIVLAPTIAKKYNFKLPMSLQGLDGNKTFSVDVTGEAFPTKLTISSHVVDFGDRVVSRDPMARATYYLEVAFRSMDMSKGFSYEIKDSPDEDSATPVEEGVPPLFFISPVRGDLAPNSSTPVRVTFQPQTSGNFSKRLHIYITGQPDPDRPYYTLLCRGSAVFPRMTFTNSNVQLPPVPLGTTSRAAFTIFNKGYSSLKVKHKVSPAITVPIEVSFPDGDEFGITVDRIKVVISAKLESSASWGGKIEFLDNDGERFVVNVSGASDNSIMTNYPFIKNYSDSYGFLGLESQPVLFMRKSDIVELRAQDQRRKEQLRKQRALERQGKAASGSISSNDSKKMKGKEDHVPDGASVVRVDDTIEGVDPEKGFEQVEGAFDHREAVLVMKWLNRNICRVPFDEERFPQCITENFGDVVVDCIEQLGGKKIAGIKPGTEAEEAPTSGIPGSRRSDRGETPNITPGNAKLTIVNRLLAKYQTIINYLVKCGALLSHINPMALLGLDDHLLAQEQELKRIESNRFTINVLAEATKSWAASWLLNCQQGWMDILFQSIKVFTLSRVTYADFVNMPGVHLAVEDSVKSASNSSEVKGKKLKAKGPTVPIEYSKSNVYTQSESVLLAWLAYHIHHASNLEDQGAERASSDARLVGLNKRLCDFNGDLRSLYPFLQVIHSHLPEATKHGGPLYGYTMIDRTKEGPSFGALLAAMESARILFDFAEDELNSSGRTLLLLALHLFLNLPSLLSKAKIEFKGAVGSTIIKTIELKNPSKKKVTYNVTLQGSSDFFINSKELTLLPESTAEFQVSLKARFFEPVTATITFWGVREAGVAGSTMVFQLVSCMISRKPEASIKKTVSLFEMDSIPLNIVSPFSRDCMLPVRMLHHFVPLSSEDALKGNPINPKLKGVPTGSALAGEVNAANRDRDSKIVVDEDKEMEKMFTVPFWATEDSFQLPAAGSKTLVINVLPFMIGVYTCHVVLLDASLGEFCYEIILNVGLPKSSEKLDFTALRDGTTTQKKIQFASKNTLFEKALTLITDVRLTNPSKKGKARSILNSLMASSVADESTGASQFVVDILSPYFNTTKEIPFISEYLLLGGNSGPSTRPDTQGSKFKKVQRTTLETVSPQDVITPGLNTSIVSFSPDKAGAYSTKIAVFSKNNKKDIRILDLSVVVTMPDVKVVLEFKGHARQKLSQEIPVLNESGRDWNLVANVTGRGFAGPKNLVVPKGAQAAYPLSFTGPYAGSFEGTMTLSNKDGEHHDHFDYTLIGVVGDPLAEEHLYFTCKARTRQTLSIPLKSIPMPGGGGAPKLDKKGQPIPVANTSGPIFEVQTDLPYVTGPAEIEIGNSGAVYEFSVLCPVGGVMSGSISFSDSSGALLWYTVDIEVSAPLPESIIEATSMVRKAVAVEISLENPTSESLAFHVTSVGDGLLGDSTYILPANSPGSNTLFYELIYSPLIPGEYEGKISFYNERVGEFWYKLHLTALSALPTVVPVAECMVGGTKIVDVPIENPLGEEVTLTVDSSDMDHFFVASDQVVLGPYSQTTFPLQFRPSSLTDMAYAEVVLSHPDFGSLQYNVSGKGLLPGVMPPAQIFAPLNEIGSYTIAFRNPFGNPLPVDIVMNEEGTVDEHDVGDSDKGFNLLLRKKDDIVIPPKTPMQISIGFSPRRLGEYRANVNIRSNIGGRSLLWCFPIVGMAEAGNPQVLDVLQTPCKTSLLRDVDVFLKGLRIANLAQGDTVSATEFSLELVVPDKNKELVARSFRVQPIELVILSEPDIASGSDFVMRYRILFEPLKTFTANVEMLIESKNRGRWRVQVELDGTDPEPDDTVSLVSAVGSTDKISFRLSNRFLGYSTFQAYFNAKSSPHFSVSPATGVLAPYGSEGTTFVVTFSPIVYGLKEIGTLTIVTEDAQWSYECHGSYPELHIDMNQIMGKTDSKRRR